MLKPSQLPFQKTPSECYDININHNCALAHLSRQNAEPRMLIKGAEFILENFILEIRINTSNNNTEYLKLTLDLMSMSTNLDP